MCHRQQVKSRRWTLSLRCCKQSQIEHIMGMYIISFLDNMLLDTCLLTAVDRDPVYWKLVLTNNSEGCDYAVYITGWCYLASRTWSKCSTCHIPVHCLRFMLGKQGWHSGESTRLLPRFYLGYLRGRSSPPPKKDNFIITSIFINYSSSPNGLRVNSPWSRRPY